MKKKIILHIGCEKTGTTSIQNTLFFNKQLLAERDSILYPKSLGGKNHWKIGIYACDEDKNLTRHLAKGESLEVFRNKLEVAFSEEVAASEASTIIISNEWLHSRVRNQNEFERLKQLLLKVSDNIQVIMYVRRQDKMAVSLYSTALKAGKCHPFSFPAVSSKKSLPYYYDFFSIYKNWVSLVGGELVTVRGFDKKFLYKGDVVKDFINEVGLDEKGFVYMNDDNLSLTLLGTKVLRVVNYFIFPFENKLSHRFKRNIRYKVASYFPGKLSIDLNSKEAKLFFGNFYECNRDLVLEYKKNSGKDLFF